MLTLRIAPAKKHKISPYLYMQFMEPLGVADASVDAGWDFIENDWYPVLIEKGITPQIHLTDARIVRNVNRSELARVFSNLLNNAVKYSDGDLEITLSDTGEITFTTIWGGKTRKELFRINIRDFQKIAPYDEAAEAYVTAQKCNRDFRCMSSLQAPDLYYGIFMLGDEKCVVYFEATEKALKILKYYNIGTVVVPTSK